MKKIRDLATIQEILDKAELVRDFPINKVIYPYQCRDLSTPAQLQAFNEHKEKIVETRLADQWDFENEPPFILITPQGDQICVTGNSRLGACHLLRERTGKEEYLIYPLVRVIYGERSLAREIQSSGLDNAITVHDRLPLSASRAQLGKIVRMRLIEFDDDSQITEDWWNLGARIDEAWWQLSDNAISRFFSNKVPGGISRTTIGTIKTKILSEIGDEAERQRYSDMLNVVFTEKGEEFVNHKRKKKIEEAARQQAESSAPLASLQGGKSQEEPSTEIEEAIIQGKPAQARSEQSNQQGFISYLVEEKVTLSRSTIAILKDLGEEKGLSISGMIECLIGDYSRMREENTELKEDLQVARRRMDAAEASNAELKKAIGEMVEARQLQSPAQSKESQLIYVGEPKEFDARCIKANPPGVRVPLKHGDPVQRAITKTPTCPEDCLTVMPIAEDWDKDLYLFVKKSALKEVAKV